MYLIVFIDRPLIGLFIKSFTEFIISKLFICRSGILNSTVPELVSIICNSNQLSAESHSLCMRMSKRIPLHGSSCSKDSHVAYGTICAKSVSLFETFVTGHPFGYVACTPNLKLLILRAATKLPPLFEQAETLILLYNSLYIG
jgi:hypothetical protein